MWNLAYGTKEYDIGFGQEPFYKYNCPETRCYSTQNRTYLQNVDDFDAILFHQRPSDLNDLPESKDWRDDGIITKPKDQGMFDNLF